MNALEKACGHDDEAGFVCALCAVEVQRALAAAQAAENADCPACPETRKALAEMTQAADEGLVRLGLLRSLAALWAAAGSPLAGYMARRVRRILDADAAQLEALRQTRLVPREELGGEEAGDEAAQPDADDHVGRGPSGRRGRRS